MRRILLVALAVLFLCGFKSYIDANGLLHWYFNSDTDLYSSSGVEATIASASPPAALIATPTSGTEPFFVTPSVNDALVGPYGLYTSPAVDNLIHRASFETCDGSDHPVGWTIHEDSGGAVGCAGGHKAKGAYSVQCVATAGQHAGVSQCVTVDNAEDYIISWYAHGTSNAEKHTTALQEYSTGDCSGGALATRYIVDDYNLPAGWSKLTNTITSWNGSTASAKIAIYGVFNPPAPATAYIDEVNWYQSVTPVDSSCTCDTDATCSCSSVIPSIITPYTSGTWQFEATIRSPIDGAVTSPDRYIFYTPETGATNKNRVDFFWDSDMLTLDVYTDAGVLKTATIAAAGNADTEYAVKAYHTDTGRIAVCWEGSCGTEATGATTTTPNVTTYIGATNSAPGEIHIKDVTWRRRLTEPLGTP